MNQQKLFVIYSRKEMRAPDYSSERGGEDVKFYTRCTWPPTIAERVAHYHDILNVGDHQFSHTSSPISNSFEIHHSILTKYCTIALWLELTSDFTLSWDLKHTNIILYLTLGGRHRFSFLDFTYASDRRGDKFLQ